MTRKASQVTCSLQLYNGHVNPMLASGRGGMLTWQPWAVQYIRDKYWEYEYNEVVTPNMFNLDLWKTSGHADHYKARCPWGAVYPPLILFGS